ncbi:MAG: YfbU family protein [Vitreimonas sp.]
MPPKSERFEMRLDPVLLDRLDQWAEENGGITRTEAVRDLILLGLDRSSPRHGVHITDGEKLIVAMIADLLKDKSKREMDPNEIMDAIYGGHLWALKWEMDGLFHDHVDAPGAVSLVVDTLDMWSFIEEAVEAFSATERKKLATELGPTGRDPKFLGFDGNYETEYLGIASHLVNRMDRFTRFKGRELNSHMPVVARYARMTRAFQPMRASLASRRPIKLTLNEVIALLRRDDG